MKAECSKFIDALKLLGLSIILGILGGMVGALFSHFISFATIVRANNYWILFFLPLSGLIIVFLYKILKISGQSTNTVIETADGTNILSPFLSVGIIGASFLSHLFGASVGREGAAVQIGGSLSVLVSKIFKTTEQQRQILVRVGLAAVFSAVFGTPIAAFLFALEIVTVGKLHLKSALPSFLSSLIGYFTASLCGAHAERFTLKEIPPFSLLLTLKILVLTVMTAFLSIVFCYTLRFFEKFAKKIFKNAYIRIFAGGLIIVFLTLLIGKSDYNGAGINIIEKVFDNGEFDKSAFALKLLFTAISVAAGFKGGEIVPTLFVGALFGAFMSNILGLPIAFSAALCMILLFCGVTNCPLSSIALGFELFSGVGFWYFVPFIALCFLISGKVSLYKSQKIELPYNFLKFKA